MPSVSSIGFDGMTNSSQAPTRLPAIISGTSQIISRFSILSFSFTPLTIAAVQSSRESSGTRVETGMTCASTGAAISDVPKPAMPNRI